MNKDYNSKIDSKTKTRLAINMRDDFIKFFKENPINSINDVRLLEYTLAEFYVSEELLNGGLNDFTYALSRIIQKITPNLEELCKKYNSYMLLEKLSKCYNHIIANYDFLFEESKESNNLILYPLYHYINENKKIQDKIKSSKI